MKAKNRIGVDMLIFILCFCVTAVAWGQDSDAGTAFDRETGQWRIGWPGRVAKHDLVYLTPPGDPMRGIPLGGGDVGVLCWTEGSKLIMAVNKSNLWDDAAIERFNNWANDQEDTSTTLRHAGRIILDFNSPIFDVFYLKDFEARLSLADATLTIRADGPFGSISLTLQVTQPDGVIVGKLKSDFYEPTRIDLILERYGSRTFSHWYSLVNRDPAIGLAGTQSGGDEHMIYLTHSLTTGRFAVGAAVCGRAAEYERINSHTSCLLLKGAAQNNFSFTAIVTDPLEADQAIEQVKKQIIKLSPDKIQSLVEKNQQLWKAFWMRSMMEYGNDYYDNLWYLMMYYANASQKGRYPGRFCNSLWAWDRDVQPWNFYFHWNQQQIYWPLNAAGHHDLLDSYLNYRFNSLPYAKKDAKEVFGVEGAVVSDVTDRRGCNSASEFINHTPVAEIAMDFWRQYQYTGDLDFLKTRVLPYMTEAASFFESLFEKGDDGFYHAKNGAGYEGWIELRDVITELTYGKVLFEAVLEAARIADVQLPQAEKWRELARTMAPPKTIKADEHWMTFDGNRRRYKLGAFKGRRAPSQDLLSCGYEPEKKQWVTVLTPKWDPMPSSPAFYRVLQRLEMGQSLSWEPKIDDEYQYYEGIFPTAEYAVVFPSGLVGLAQNDTPLFNAAVNTACLYGADMMGWDTLPIVLARLGQSKELAHILHRHPDRWQFYCNGLGHYGPLDNAKSATSMPYYKSRVRDASLSYEEQAKPENQFLFELYPFRHMDLEAIAVFATAMNEALLQSYDGIIRIAPAVTKDQNARFSLHAVGGFIVSAEIQSGEPLWIFIRNLRGNPCTIDNPWPNAHIYINQEYYTQTGDKRIRLNTRADDGIMLVPDKDTWQNWKSVEIDYPANPKEKLSPEGYTSLGLPRMF